MNTIKRFIFNAAQTQLLLTAMALPILVYWGLKTSLMTLVGNIIFTPVLTLMLVVSSLIFFAELFFMPHHLLTQMYEMLTYAWSNALGTGSNTWMIGFYNPGILMLSLIPLSIFLLLKSPWGYKLQTRVWGMFIIVSLSCISLWGYGLYQARTTYTSSGFSIIRSGWHSIDFHDHGYFNKKVTPDKSIEFELSPSMTKLYGHFYINNILLDKPSYRSFLGALALCKNYSVKRITIPFWSKKADDKKILWAYRQLMSYTKRNGILVIRR